MLLSTKHIDIYQIMEIDNGFFSAHVGQVQDEEAREDTITPVNI